MPCLRLLEYLQLLGEYEITSGGWAAARELRTEGGHVIYGEERQLDDEQGPCTAFVEGLQPRLAVAGETRWLWVAGTDPEWHTCTDASSVVSTFVRLFFYRTGTATH